MKQFTFFTVAFVLATSAIARLVAAPADHVNPFIGTVSGSGNTYPGAQVPFGMISWSPHTLEGSAVGYNYKNSTITGFGLVHQSGVGCGVTCEIPFMPCTGDLSQSPVTVRGAYNSPYSHTNESAAPGYYSVNLSRWQTDFETTVTERAGMAHFRFPRTNQAHVLFVPTLDANGLRDGSFTIDPTNRTLSGWMKSGGFCGNNRNDYTVYFCAQFERPFAHFGTWTKADRMEQSATARGDGIAAYLTFDCTKQETVAMKVGLSFVSEANARLNLDREIPKWNFAAIKSAARRAWNTQLNRIQISGGTAEDTTIFYTALYHALMLPSIFEDGNGEYRGMDDRIYTVKPGHHYLSTFSGWDTYRTQAQLWGWLYPEVASDFCESLLAMAQQSRYKGGGGLPLWSLFNDETHIMSGYPASPYIASAFAFGATNFDVAALKNVMVDSGKNQRWCGRNEGVTWDQQPEYKAYGYVPSDVSGDSCSKTVEYSVADFAIAQLCLALGDNDNFDYFFKRSQTVFKLYNSEHGYLQRRKKDGSWEQPFDRFAGAGFSEGNSAHYTWTVPHSINKLLKLAGGPAAAEAKLDEITSQLAHGYDYQAKFYEAGNEPCFGIMPVYNWLGKPWKTQERTRMVLRECFANSPSGIPGDDDSGAMAAWYIFMSLGIYPEIPGLGGFTVVSPLFPKAEIKLPNGKSLQITARNVSRDAKYIHSLKVSGKPSSKLWLTVAELNAARKLEFVMKDSPNRDWGTSPADAPPSFETE